MHTGCYPVFNKANSCPHSLPSREVEHCVFAKTGRPAESSAISWVSRYSGDALHEAQLKLS